MNTNITAELNQIRHDELLREAAHERLAAEARGFRSARPFRLSLPRRPERPAGGHWLGHLTG